VEFSMQEHARTYKGVDPQDVKAAIRKKFGHVTQFHRFYDLPSTGVHDLLRGRASARVEAVMDEFLAEAGLSTHMDSTADSTAQHLNAEAK
jgi:hypothetical protein